MKYLACLICPCLIAPSHLLAQEPTLRTKLEGNYDVIWSVAFTPDGKTLATSGHETAAGEYADAITTWDLASEKRVFLLAGFSGPVRSFTMSRDGNLLAAGNAGKAVLLFEVRTGKLIAKLSNGDLVNSVALTANGERLASGGSKSIKLWDLASGMTTATLRTEDSVDCLVFLPEGRLLASAGASGAVALWEVPQGKLAATLKGHAGSVRSLAISPDGKTLASAADDGTIKLWNVATRNNLSTLRGHNGGVRSVAFRSDGKYLASGSVDGTIRLWEVATGRNTATVSGHGDGVNSVAYSADGTTLASGGRDGVIKLWDVGTKTAK